MALDEPLENEIRDHEEQRFSFSDSLEAGWQALTPAARSEVIMEDFADSLADGSLLASARYYFAIRKEDRRFRTPDEDFEAGIPNPFKDPEHDEEEEENFCIEIALDAKRNERPDFHVKYCECELCAKNCAIQPLDAMTRKERELFYKMEDIMFRLVEESDHPALTDYVFDSFGKYCGAMYNVSGETMDQLHVVYHDDCECQECKKYAMAPRDGEVSVKTPVIMTSPAVKRQKASAGTVAHFEDPSAWI
jgi:hypothetical protein